eukprot:868574-Pyramimonas_sp.AAC.1
MRVIDLQESLWTHDAKLTRATIDPKTLAQSWGSKKITFGERHRGKTFEAVLAQHPDYCDWIRGSAKNLNDAMRQFI